MNFKKITKILFTTAIMSSLFICSASANTYVDGTSDGGSYGKVECDGSIRASGGYVTAATNVDTNKGTKAVHISVYDSENGSRQKDFSTSTARSVSGKIGYTPYSATSAEARHSYSSSEYGDWYGETNIDL